VPDGTVSTVSASSADGLDEDPPDKGAPMATGDEPIPDEERRLARVSDGLARLFSEYYGRGPSTARSWRCGPYVFCALEDCLTTAEEQLLESGRPDLVRRLRLSFQAAMTQPFCDTVSEELGRPIVAYHSQVVFDPNICFEIFVLGDEEGDAAAPPS
jgi:uncharacterized protein YbcI